MKKPKIKITVTTEETGYSAYAFVANNSINTEGNNLDELKNNIVEAVNLAFEDEGFEYAIDEIELEYDLESFFSIYKVINVSALSERVGINRGLLSQYASGVKKASAGRTAEILNGVRELASELSKLDIVNAPLKGIMQQASVKLETKITSARRVNSFTTKNTVSATASKRSGSTTTKSTAGKSKTVRSASTGEIVKR